jgi:type I restriction enzyme M protein
MLGEIFKKARMDIQNPATLRRLIVDLIEPVKWSSMDADVKGDIYEGLLAKSAEESPKGAGQYFTPRELIKAIVDCVQPPVGTVRSGLQHRRLPAGCRTPVARHHRKALVPTKKRLRKLRAWLGAGAAARLFIMNLTRHRRRSLPGTRA